MGKRDKIKENMPKKQKDTKPNETYSVPNILATPKNKDEKEQQVMLVNREKNEIDSKITWLDPIQNLSSRDLGTISRPELYPGSKVDWNFNRGVKRAKNDLRLLDFLLKNLRPYYRKQIISSNEFDNIIKEYLNIDAFDIKLTREEREKTLAIAAQMLINSLTIIQSNMPPEFSEVLKQTGKPYFSMIEAITNYAKTNNDKSIPSINIPDSLR